MVSDHLLSEAASRMGLIVERNLQELASSAASRCRVLLEKQDSYRAIIAEAQERARKADADISAAQNSASAADSAWAAEQRAESLHIAARSRERAALEQRLGELRAKAQALSATERGRAAERRNLMRRYDEWLRRRAASKDIRSLRQQQLNALRAEVGDVDLQAFEFDGDNITLITSPLLRTSSPPPESDRSSPFPSHPPLPDAPTSAVGVPAPSVISVGHSAGSGGVEAASVSVGTLDALATRAAVLAALWDECQAVAGPVVAASATAASLPAEPLEGDAQKLAAAAEGKLRVAGEGDVLRAARDAAAALLEGVSETKGGLEGLVQRSFGTRGLDVGGLDEEVGGDGAGAVGATTRGVSAKRGRGVTKNAHVARNLQRLLAERVARERKRLMVAIGEEKTRVVALQRRVSQASAQLRAQRASKQRNLPPDLQDATVAVGSAENVAAARINDTLRELARFEAGLEEPFVLRTKAQQRARAPVEVAVAALEAYYTDLTSSYPLVSTRTLRRRAARAADGSEDLEDDALQADGADAEAGDGAIFRFVKPLRFDVYARQLMRACEAHERLCMEEADALGCA